DEARRRHVRRSSGAFADQRLSHARLAEQRGGRRWFCVGLAFGVGLAMLRVLEPAAQAQLSQARELLARLRDTLAEFGAAAEDRAALAVSIRQLDELFLIVCVGEFNAGKSAFI